MKVINEETPVAGSAIAGVANGYTRLYSKIDGSIVDVHNVDAREYLSRLSHSWSAIPVSQAPAASKEQIVTVDAEIVPESTKKEVAIPAEIAEDKPVSARSRKLAKFD